MKAVATLRSRVSHRIRDVSIGRYAMRYVTDPSRKTADRNLVLPTTQAIPPSGHAERRIDRSAISLRLDDIYDIVTIKSRTQLSHLSRSAVNCEPRLSRGGGWTASLRRLEMVKREIISWARGYVSANLFRGFIQENVGERITHRSILTRKIILREIFTVSWSFWNA